MPESRPNSRKAPQRKISAPPKRKFPALYLIGLGLVLVVALVVSAALLLRQPAPAASVGQITSDSGLPDEVSVAQAADLRTQGAFILDVRTSEEWAEFHIPGSTLIPVDELESRVNEVPRGRQVVVVCRSGNRSAVGRDILKGASYDQVTSMAGGLKAWRDGGLETIAGP